MNLEDPVRISQSSTPVRVDFPGYAGELRIGYEIFSSVTPYFSSGCRYGFRKNENFFDWVLTQIEEVIELRVSTGARDFFRAWSEAWRISRKGEFAAQAAVPRKNLPSDSRKLFCSLTIW